MIYQYIDKTTWLNICYEEEIERYHPSNSQCFGADMDYKMCLL